MDISGTIASVLWKDNPDQARPAEMPRESRESLEEFTTKLVRDERHAREAALAEMRKMLDWRFVHFAEEFRQQLNGLGLGGADCAKEQPRASPGRAELEQRLAPEGRGPGRRRQTEQHLSAALGEHGDSFAEEPRLHLLEGKFAIAEHRIAEVQRWAQAFEQRSDNEQGRLAEVEAWLAHLDRRLCDAERQMGGRRGAPVGSRLATVERLSIEGRSHEALQAEPNGLGTGAASRSAGGSSGSAFSGADYSGAPRCRVDLQLGGLLGKDKPSLCSPSTKVSTNYATPSSQQSLTPSSPNALRPYGSR